MTQKPANEIRYGTVKVTLWLNETAHGPRYNVKPSRIFKVDEEWKESQSFGRDDLLVLGKALGEAHTWICDQIRGG